MILTTHVIAAGERWGAAFPRIDRERCFPKIMGKMTADDNECLKALDNEQYITHSSKDTAFLRSVVCHWIWMVNDWKDGNSIGKDAKGYSRTMDRISRRAENMNITYVRTEWRQKANGQLKVRFRLRNDGVVENREWERIFAWKLAEAVSVISEDMVERGMLPIEMDELCVRLIAELKEHCEMERKARELCELNAGRKTCANHCNGYCSPSKPGCPCYRDGRCEEVKDGE